MTRTTDSDQTKEALRLAHSQDQAVALSLMNTFGRLVGSVVRLVNAEGKVLLSTNPEENATTPMWPLERSEAEPNRFLSFPSPRTNPPAWTILVGPFDADDNVGSASRQRREDLPALFQVLAETLDRLWSREEEIESLCRERDEASQRLTESEDLYRALADGGQALIWTAGTDGLCNYFNRPWLAFTGRTLEQELGEGWTEGVHPDDFAFCMATYTEAFEARKPFSMDYRLRRYDGDYRWIQDDGSPRYDGDGRFLGYIGHCLDITDKKRAEEAQGRRLQALTLPLDAVEVPCFEDLFDLKEIQQLQDDFAKATGVATLIVRPDGSAITKPGDFCRLCQDLIRGTKKGQENCRCSDVTLGAHHPKGPIVQPCLSGGLWDAGASITVGGKHIASWLVGQVRDETQSEEAIRAYAREIGADEEACAQAFAEVPSMSAERFRQVAQALFVLANQLSKAAYQNIQQARFITEKKRIETARQDSEDRLLRAELVARSGNWEFDLNRRTVYTSQGARRIYGLSEKEWTIQAVQAFPLPEYRPMLDAALVGLVEHGDPYDVEFKIRRPTDGAVLDIRSVAEYDPVRRVVFGIIQDITDRKQAERAQQESEERYRAIVESSHSAICIVDEQAKVTWINPRMTVISGYTEEQFLSRQSFAAFIAPESLKFVIGNFGKFLAGEPYEHHYSFRFVRADGEIRDAEKHMEEYRDRYGKRFLIISILDVTERNRVERALRESEERYQLAIQGSSDGIWDWDLRMNGLFLSPRWKEIVGYTDEELPNDFKTFPDLLHPQDKDRVQGEIDRYLRGGAPVYRCEFRLRHKNGGYRWVLSRGQALWDEQGVPFRMAGSHTDITERKKADEALRDSEERYRSLFDSMREGFALHEIILDEDGEPVDYRFLTVNPAFERMTGQRALDIVGKTVREVLPGTEDTWIKRYGRVALGGPAEQFEDYALALDRWFFVSASSPRKGQFATIFSDITDRKRAEEALRESETRYESFINTHTDLMYVKDEAFRHIVVNRKLVEFFGCSKEDLIGKTDFELMPEEAALHCRESDLAALRGGKPITGEEIVGDRVFETTKFPLPLKGNRIGLGGIIRDITEKKRAEVAIRESEARFRSIAENTSDLIALSDDEGVILYASSASRDIFRCEPEQMQNRHFLTFVDESSMPKALEAFQAAIMENADLRNMEFTMKRVDGSSFIGELSGSMLRIENQARALVVIRDITDRKKAEEDLKRRESELRKIFEVLPVGLWFADKNGTLLNGNPEGVRIWGAEPHVPMEQYGVFKARRLPSRQELAPEDWALVRTIRERETVLDEVLEIDAFDGETRIILNSTAPVVDDEGTVLGAIVVNQDITEQKQMEQQLLQAQKMESIGRLAGGVAHDFNNLLTGITGNVSMALLDLFPGDPLHESLEEIKQAADSAASLTRQLLAFSRNQIVEPKVLDLNEIISRSTKMLGRLIGEDVELVFLPAKNLGRVRMDPGQVEQILVNLAVNARDAMPDGGKLTLETADITLDEAHERRRGSCPAGDYVMIAVSDNGMGMDTATMEHLFEPFFTTKEKGKGTGLGLATVYGAVKQGHGGVDVYSEPGRGTTFKIYLPRVEEQAERLERKAPETMPKGTETVFLVEDEVLVRDLATKVLTRLGYQVFAFANGAEALHALADFKAPLHLLLTDVIMPGMNGRVLAEAVRKERPDVAVLFTSGYTENVIAHHGVLEEGIQFIGKPYTPQGLANKIRTMLDRSGKVPS